MPPHILINTLLVNIGGSFAVTQNLIGELASLRPDWRLTLALISDFDDHKRLVDEGILNRAVEILREEMTRQRYELPSDILHELS